MVQQSKWTKDKQGTTSCSRVSHKRLLAFMKFLVIDFFLVTGEFDFVCFNIPDSYIQFFKFGALNVNPICLNDYCFCG